MSHAVGVNGHTVGHRIGYTRVSTVVQTLDAVAGRLDVAIKSAADSLRTKSMQ